MMRVTRIAIVGLIALCSGTSGPGQVPQQAPQAPQAPANQTPAAAKPGTLTLDDIKVMLEKEGFKSELLVVDKNSCHQVVIKQDGLSYTVRIYISPSGRKIWLFLATRTFGPDEEIPHDRLLTLLDSNKRVGTGHFEYNSVSRRAAVRIHL